MDEHGYKIIVIVIALLTAIKHIIHLIVTVLVTAKHNLKDYNDI
jgi:hypothetical protein